MFYEIFVYSFDISLLPYPLHSSLTKTLRSFNPAETFLLFGAFPDSTMSVITPTLICMTAVLWLSVEIRRGRKGRKQVEETEKADW